MRYAEVINPFRVNKKTKKKHFKKNQDLCNGVIELFEGDWLDAAVNQIDNM